jgi:hypothetical protein
MEELWAYHALVRNKQAFQLYPDIRPREHIQNGSYIPTYKAKGVKGFFLFHVFELAQRMNHSFI